MQGLDKSIYVPIFHDYFINMIFCLSFKKVHFKQPYVWLSTHWGFNWKHSNLEYDSLDY